MSKNTASTVSGNGSNTKTSEKKPSLVKLVGTTWGAGKVILATAVDAATEVAATVEQVLPHVSHDIIRGSTYLVVSVATEGNAALDAAINNMTVADIKKHLRYLGVQSTSQVSYFEGLESEVTLDTPEA